MASKHLMRLKVITQVTRQNTFRMCPLVYLEGAAFYSIESTTFALQDAPHEKSSAAIPQRIPLHCRRGKLPQDQRRRQEDQEDTIMHDNLNIGLGCIKESVKIQMIFFKEFV